MDAVSLISDFRGPIRFLVGDHDQPYGFADSSVDAGTILCLRAGRIPGYGYSAGGSTVTPSVTDPNVYLLISLKVAQALAVGRPDRHSVRTRAFSESSGGRGELLHYLANELHALENGTMFESWSSLGSWLTGTGGLEGERLWRHLTRASGAPVVGDVPLPVTGGDS